MSRISKKATRLALLLTATVLLATPARAHPGSAIVVDRLGNIWFLDTGAGLWKIDVKGVLTKIGGDRFHWLTIDHDNRLVKVQLPSGSAGDVNRVGTKPALLLASDFPVATGPDGSLYYPARNGPDAVRIMKLETSGRSSVLATLPATTTNTPLRWVNGLVAGPDGSLYYTENNAVRRITPEGRVSIVAKDLAPAGCVAVPGSDGIGPFLRGLAVDAAGVIYVAASGCASLLKITPDGRVAVVLQLTSPWAPTSVAVFGRDVYVLEYLHTAIEDRLAWVPRVRKVSADGKSGIIAAVERR